MPSECLPSELRRRAWEVVEFMMKGLVNRPSAKGRRACDRSRCHTVAHLLARGYAPPSRSSAAYCPA